MYALIFALLLPFTISANQCKSMDAKLKEVRKTQIDLSTKGVRGPAREFVNTEIDHGIQIPEITLQRLALNIRVKDVHFGGADKFAEHFSKHGREFPGLSQKAYLRRAQEIAESVNGEFLTFKTPYNVIKYSPVTNEMLVLDGTRIKTLFKPDLNFINDPINRARKEKFKSVFDWLVSEKIPER